MIKRGNLVFAVMICGALPLLAGVVASYWLVAGTTARIESDAKKAVLKQTRSQLGEISKAKQEIVEQHLQQIEAAVAEVAANEQLIEAVGEVDVDNPNLTMSEETIAAFEQLSLSNAFVCNAQDGSILYSWKGATDRISSTSRRMILQLNQNYHHQTASDAASIGLPFDSSFADQSQLTTVIAAPINTDDINAMVVFEVSLAAINSFVAHADDTHAYSILASNADAIADSIGKQDVSLITPVAHQNWNLSLIAKTNRNELLAGVTTATRSGASLTNIMSGGSQAATLWTAFLVVAVGTLLANHIRRPLEKSSETLQQISLEGSGLLLDSSTNQNRTALLDWISTVVRRVDTMSATITGNEAENLELSMYARAQMEEERMKRVSEDRDMEEIVRRSQRSLASAVEAARLAEQAISKLGADISPEEISDLHEVVSDINAQSQWLYEHSTWVNDTEEAAEATEATEKEAVAV